MVIPLTSHHLMVSNGAIPWVWQSSRLNTQKQPEKATKRTIDVRKNDVRKLKDGWPSSQAGFCRGVAVMEGGVKHALPCEQPSQG